MRLNDPIYVAGHLGLAGAATVRSLLANGFTNLLLQTRGELDLTQQSEVNDFFDKYRPKYVFLAAAKVGGILANSEQPAVFIQENLYIQTNVIRAAHEHGVRKLLFLGSSCIYPRLSPQPMSEDCLLTGPLEPTNEAYAIAKIAGIKMCQAYRRQFGFDAICAMPTNLYGPGDNFSITRGHALPSLLRRIQEAKERNATAVEVWGSGEPRREFLHVDDLANACVYLMQKYSSKEPINVGWGVDISIRELAVKIARVVNFDGALRFDRSQPDGMPRKLLDTTRLSRLGWYPRIRLDEGIQSTHVWFMRNRNQIRAE
jgi:GDP-L-fucose synthase